MPKKINPELRARAVRMVAEHQQDYPSVTAAAQAVAKQLGLGREAVRRWLVQADIDTGGRTGMTSAEHAEIKRLKTA
jgi:transposase